MACNLPWPLFSPLFHLILPNTPCCSLSPRPLVLSPKWEIPTQLSSLPQHPSMGVFWVPQAEVSFSFTGSAALRSVFHFSNYLFVWNPLWPHLCSQETGGCLKPETLCVWIAVSAASNTRGRRLAKIRRWVYHLRWARSCRVLAAELPKPKGTAGPQGFDLTGTQEANP